MFDSDWLIAKLLKTPWLDRMNFTLASLNSISILIVFHGKINYFLIITFINFLRLFNFAFLKIWDTSNIAFILSLLIEMLSLNINERVACLVCGKKYTRKDASRHRRTCGVLKCSRCSFYTYSSEELNNNFKKKHFQQKVKLCAQHSPNTLREKVKLIFFKKRTKHYEFFFTESEYHWR